MKKLVIFIITLLIIISIATVYFLIWFKKDQIGVKNAIVAVPVDASIILKIDDYHRFSEKLRTNSLIWKTLKDFPVISRTDSVLGLLDTLAIKNDAFNELISLNTVYFSLHTNSNQPVDFFATIALQKRAKRNQLQNLFHSIKHLEIKLLNHNGAELYTVFDIRTKKELLYYSVERGLFLCSSSIKTLENSLQQLDNKNSVFDLTDFESIFQTAGNNVAANLFINHKNVLPAFEHLLNSGYQQRLASLNDLSNWTALDFSLEDDAIYLNGFSNPSDKNGSFLGIYSRQKPLNTTVTSILPSNTSAFVWLGISDLNTYLEDYRSYLNQNGSISEYTNKLSQIKYKLGIDLHELYSTIFDKEVALIFAPFDGVDPSRCWFIVSKVKSVSQAEQVFENMIDVYSKNQTKSSKDFITSSKIDKETTSTFYHIPFKGLHSSLLGSLFSTANDEYLTIIDDFLVFGDSTDVLNKFILSNIHNNLLGVDLSYTQIKDLLSTSSNFYAYLNPSKADCLFDLYLDKMTLTQLNSHRFALNNLQGIAVQLSGGNKMIFNNIAIKYSPLLTDVPRASWETKLDTLLLGKPQILINHYTRNKEIFVQDMKNKIYLLNEVGRILWKRTLPESIIGEVTQIDLFKNGKLQVVFNTQSNIYVIDRNGKNVEGFPIKLRAKATNPVSVFDYEESKDYRFFVACDNNKILAFNNVGKSLNGWSFRKTEKLVNNPIQHFKVNRIDYIVFADMNRLYVVDRRGTEKIKYKKPFAISKNSQFILEEKTKKNPARLTITDTLGIIHYFYLNGKVEETPIKSFGSSHFFDYQDLDADGEKDFILLDDSHLYVFRQNKELIFEYKFNTPPIPKVIYYNFGSLERRLGVTSTTGNEIFLINSDGSLYDGFPLKGNSLFCISKFNNQASFNLIVGSQSGSVLNYEIK